jgi:peptidoglycan/LPS O-acetylase OafA/YrhL
VGPYPFFRFLVDGEFWVHVFFVLSGFVLPISYFKSENKKSVYKSIFRRYFRLLFPVLVVNNLVFFAKETFWDNALLYNRDYTFLPPKSYANMLWTSLIGVWFGDASWLGPEWTLSLELWCSYIVYIILLSLYPFKYRYVGYFLIIVLLLFA